MNLLAFLTDRCNLACDYCFLRLNQGPAVVLGESPLLSAVETLAAAPGEARLTLLGGEPLAHPELVRSAARRLLALRPSARVQVVTNGAALKPALLPELEALGVEVVVSLDGAADAHDAHRPTAGGGPSHARVLAALDGADRRRLRVNMVVREDTAPALLSGLRWLGEQGFRRVSFHPDVLERWSGDGLAALDRVLEGAARFARAAGERLELTHLGSYAGLDDAHGDDELVLGADGRYYPCDGLFSRPYSELGAWSAGDAASGPDWGRRERLLSQARAAIHAALGGGRHYTCPREPYFHALAAGRDPASAVRAYHEADRRFGRVLSALLAERRACETA